MNNFSPINVLGEQIRLRNSNLSEVNIIEIGNTHYVTEYSFKRFIDNNSLNDINGALNLLSEYNNISGGLSILDEQSANTEELAIIRECVILLEILNPLKVESAVKGQTLLSEFIAQATSFIKGQKYDDEKEIKKYIKKCDEMLEEIDKERKLAKDKSKDNYSALFSLYFIGRIAKTIFETYFVPLILSKVSAKIKWPNAVEKLFSSYDKIYKEIKSKYKFTGSIITISKVISAIGIIFETIENLRGLYLSFANYDSLLAEYETQIKDTKKNLENKLANATKSKESNIMIKLTESINDSQAVDVHYMAPEDLKTPITPSVVHDDEKMITDSEKPVAPSTIDNNQPSPITGVDAPVSNADYSPVDALNQMRSIPANINIAKHCDRYCIDHKDLRCYMDACGETKYENALNSIIMAHEDSGMTAEAIRVIMSQNELSNLSEEVRSEMEKSPVRFEVY